MNCRPFIVALSCAMLGGCSSLLPKGSSDTPVGFKSYEEGMTAVHKVKAMETRTGDLKDLGFDPADGRNVTLIPYPDIVGRLAPHPGVPFDKLDSGIRQCIEAQSRCRGYLFRFERTDRNREGSFWMDFLNIRRTTKITGWWFESLIVVSEDTVLFRNFAGQAHTDKVERTNNPLGPFQSSGEGSAAALIR